MMNRRRIHLECHGNDSISVSYPPISFTPSSSQLLLYMTFHRIKMSTFAIFRLSSNSINSTRYSEYRAKCWRFIFPKFPIINFFRTATQRENQPNPHTHYSFGLSLNLPKNFCTHHFRAAAAYVSFTFISCMCHWLCGFLSNTTHRANKNIQRISRRRRWY